jgi:biopolymer transport protein ExbD
MVDVVLVLLIIFMITAPVIYQSAIKVQLPKARTGEQAEKSPLNFTITKEGDLIMNKERIDWSTLNQRLSSLGAPSSSEVAVISADQSTPHGTVIRLMDALRMAGLARFALNVESNPSEPPRKN